MNDRGSYLYKNTAADCILGANREKCKVVLWKTYENALKSGDKNECFLDGDEIYNEVRTGNCTVDSCHPNDLGFYCMA